MARKGVVVGIDLGSSESYVAYVGKNNVDIAQNEASKRATPTVVGFTDRERLLGEPALALIRSNARNTCRNFKHLLGRKVEAPDLQPEHFWSTSPLCACADGHAGYSVSYKGQARQMSAVEVTAMYLTKLREMAEQWCQGSVMQCVISCPSSFSDVQRQAVLDAAHIANIQVLRVLNEHAATALAYGIYRSNDFDPDKPMTVAFCSMGNAIFSVSIVQFLRGRLTVLAEKSAKAGGRDMDECMMREFAAQFQQKVGADPLTSKKACFKLEDAVVKTKKVLSANKEAPINVECLMEDRDFASIMQREDLERMCEPAMVKVRAVLDAVLKSPGVCLDMIDSVEIVGGGSRVPWVKQLISEAFGGKELSTTMNQEESVARGCALMAAMLSPLYKVRDFSVVDVTPFPISVSWAGQATCEEAGKEEGGEAPAATHEGGGEFKGTVIFPAGTQMNTLKALTFVRKGPFDIRAEIADPSLLLPLTPKELGTWTVHLPEQGEAKKVKVRVRLTLNGTFEVEGAELQEQEEYEEVVKEKREVTVEVKKDGDSPIAEGDAAEEKKEEKPAENKVGGEKKYEWVDVRTMKKRTKRIELMVTAAGRPGLSPAMLQKLRAAESAMQADMRSIIETDKARNDVEAYIFSMRDKCSDGGVYEDFISAATRDTFMDELTKAEDWLYDNVDATTAVYVEKLAELKTLGDPVALRHKEDGLRAESTQAVRGTINKYRTLAAEPGEKFGHIAPEKLAKVMERCAELEHWLSEREAQQKALPKHEPPVLVSADMEKKRQELARTLDAIFREPRPAPTKQKDEPKKEEPSAEDAANQNEAQAAAREDTTSTNSGDPTD